MILLPTKRGEKALRKLDPPVRARALVALQAFVVDHTAPGLNFEQLEGTDGLHSIRINRNFRIILKQADVANTFEVWAVGPHDIYRRLGGDD